MISEEALKRDVRANIADWPVECRWKGRQFTAGLASYQDLETLMQGGLLDDMTINILAVIDDFGPVMPRQREKFEVREANGKWLAFDIASVPDRHDPLGPTISINLQSPDKG